MAICQMRSVHIQQTVECVRRSDYTAITAYTRHTGRHIMAIRYANITVERRIHADR